MPCVTHSTLTWSTACPIRWYRLVGSAHARTIIWAARCARHGAASVGFALRPKRGPPAADPIPLFGPPEGGVFRLLHDGGLVAPSGLINEIGTLWPIAPCGRTSLWYLRQSSNFSAASASVMIRSDQIMLEAGHRQVSDYERTIYSSSSQPEPDSYAIHSETGAAASCRGWLTTSTSVGPSKAIASRRT